jgi:hypothetical protein
MNNYKGIHPDGGITELDQHGRNTIEFYLSGRPGSDAFGPHLDTAAEMIRLFAADLTAEEVEGHRARLVEARTGQMALFEVTNGT